MADTVMRMKDPAVQAKTDTGLFFKPAPVAFNPIQRKYAYYEEEQVQRREMNNPEEETDATPPAPLSGYRSLKIVGPKKINHYCAAYEPSDSASCGTYPAPDIRLNVKRTADETTLIWDISKGASKASIIGPTNLTTALIRGDAPSDKKGDVIVSVSNGISIATKKITVREPKYMIFEENPDTTPTAISNTITYYVQDQFHDVMEDGICIDETITICHNSHPGVKFKYGDAPTNNIGQVQDHLSATSQEPFSDNFCIRANQTMTAGGCGPLMQNTIVCRNTGIVLLPGTSCTTGSSCP